MSTQPDPYSTPPEPAEPTHAEQITDVLRGDARSSVWGDAGEMLFHLACRDPNTRYEDRAAEIVTRLAEATRLEQMIELGKTAQRWVAEVIEDAKEQP